MDQYLKGEVVYLVWSVTNNPSGVLVDSSNQRVKYFDPAIGTQTTVAYTDGTSGIIHDSTGNYHYNLAVNSPGMWWVRIETDPPNQGADEYRFEVRATRFS